jgi:carboxyl-terminal processing protease
MVTHLVDKGPAQKKGILPFDRILMVDKKKFFGKGITNDQVFASLRGDMGSRVKLQVYRPRDKTTNEFNIIRGVIPVPSIDCAIMLTQNTGLIRISQFGENTFVDFLTEARKLRNAGMKKLILDLRDNGGGYLQAAENIADQFLKDKVKIVYTKGQNQGQYDYTATSNGEFEDMPLVVLVNHNSASASEIVAGAIQDNDRGAIVGRRTFGKGLVQQQFGAFSDGSALRLTVSRYYTPSGRCIQRPYGKGIDYYHDGVDRYNNQEFYKPDSSKFVDSLKYKTINKKRIVYGGGGIMPDVFVPLDTSYNTMFYANVLDKNCINSFAFNFVETNKAKFTSEKGPSRFNLEFIVDDAMWNEFKNFAAAKGVGVPSAEEDARSKKWIGVLIKAEIARLIYNSQGYFLVRMINDYEVKKAMASFWN